MTKVAFLGSGPRVDFFAMTVMNGGVEVGGRTEDEEKGMKKGDEEAGVKK